MFKNLTEVKSFIKWAKTQKLKVVKLGELEFEISELDYIVEDEKSLLKEKLNLGSDTWADKSEEAAQPQDDEEALFWSSN